VLCRQSALGWLTMSVGSGRCGMSETQTTSGPPVTPTAVTTSGSADANGQGGPAGRSGSAWDPFRIHVFRMLWLAALVSNLGGWMHLVAAGWLMTSLTASAALVALLQTANSLPSFLLALPGGAMADVYDRRQLILVTQGFQLLVAAALGLLTVTGAVTPWALLGLTVLLGAGFTLGTPAYAAITPDLVPARQLPAAISLNSMTITASLAVGPALGGLLVAWIGPGPVFLLNAVSFVAVIIAVGSWRPPGRVSTLPPEHVLSATRTGLRYVVNAPEFVAVLVRTIAYVTAFSAVPALLAVVTRTQLGGSAADYGLLLGFAGLGGLISAFVLPRIRQRVSTDTLVLAATGGYACTLLAVGTARNMALLIPFLLLGGFVQMTTMSSLSIAAQQVLPAWVRGRGLAVFLLTFQLGLAGGAAIWGTVASTFGLPRTFAAAAILMLASALLAPLFRLNAAAHIDVHPAHHPEQYAPVQVKPDDGPVLITTEYDVPAQRLPAFVTAAHRLKQMRRREGALSWALFEDVERRGTHIENYLMTSWTEHRRQADRRTGDDQKLLDEITEYHDGNETPRTRYLLGHHFRRHHQT
jgi:predicted MFS family arabinose efflux permease